MVSSDWLQQWSPDYCPGVNTPHYKKKQKTKKTQKYYVVIIIIVVIFIIIRFFQVVVWTPRLAITAQTC